MSIATIGRVIAQLRNARHVTQEELARSVGVSAQAVSKWENGGVPDAALLPGIADFFGVSIDTLFSRDITDYSDMETALAKRIVDTPPDERFETVFELCWVMEQALMGGILQDDSIKSYREALPQEEQRYSSIRTDSGYTLMGIANRLPYFLIVPETGDKDAALLRGIDYPSLFRDLADETVFHALIMLYKRASSKAFTPNLLVKELGITVEKAADIIGILSRYRFIRTTQIDLDDITQEVYTFTPTPSFPALLIFAREIIDPPHSFSYYSESRTTPYLA